MNRRSLFSLRNTLTALATTVLATLALPSLAEAATKTESKAKTEAHAHSNAKESKEAGSSKADKASKQSKHGESRPEGKASKASKDAHPASNAKGGHASGETKSTKESKVAATPADAKAAKAATPDSKADANAKKSAAVAVPALSKETKSSPKPEKTKPVHEFALSKVEPAAPEAKAATPKAATPKERRSKRTATRGAGKGAERASDSKAPTRRAAREASSKRRCESTTVTMDRGGQEAQSLELLDCQGKVLKAGRRDFSVLARPWSVPRPNAKALAAALKSPAKAVRSKAGGGGVAEKEPAEFAPGVRMLDEGLALRMAAIAKQFPGAAISLVSGYRPTSRGSQHQEGRAVDFHLSGVPNEKVVAFCRTLPDTGCGYYPNSSFVHVDVREKGQGSASWIDASGPGEAPHYVSEWPPRASSAPAAVAAAEPGAQPPTNQPPGAAEAASAPVLLKTAPIESPAAEPVLSLPALVPSASSVEAGGAASND